MLFAHFLARAAKRFRCEPPVVGQAVWRHLGDYGWPGNVRELAHYAERVAHGLDDDQGGPPPTPEVRPPLPQRVNAFEADLIRDALAAHHGDVQATIAALGIPRKTFYDKFNGTASTRTSTGDRRSPAGIDVGMLARSSPERWR